MKVCVVFITILFPLKQYVVISTTYPLPPKSSVLKKPLSFNLMLGAYLQRCFGVKANSELSLYQGLHGKAKSLKGAVFLKVHVFQCSIFPGTNYSALSINSL